LAALFTGHASLVGKLLNGIQITDDSQGFVGISSPTLIKILMDFGRIADSTPIRHETRESWVPLIDEPVLGEIALKIKKTKTWVIASWFTVGFTIGYFLSRPHIP